MVYKYFLFLIGYPRLHHDEVPEGRMKKNKTTLEDKMAIVDTVAEYILNAIETEASNAIGISIEKIKQITEENRILKEHIKLLNAERKANQYEAIMAKLNDTVSSIEWKMNQSMAQIKRLVK